jgi:anaerobic magnesium-protoporphyrin IX monomethyl ester cyclase
MHFVLVQPPIGRSVVSVTPALGLPYIAAILENNGMKVSVIVSDAEDLNVEDTAKRVTALCPDFLGISVCTLTSKNSYKIAEIVKREISNMVLIAGGPHATVLPDEALNNGFDFVVIGEGEKTIGEFVEYIQQKRKLREIKGLAYWNDGNIQYNEKQPLFDKLDDLPFPAWHLFPLAKYNSDFKKSSRNLPVMTSRGCPFKCTFCYKELFGNKFRMRSPESIVNEIEYLKNNFSIDAFDIIDDHFTAIPKRAIEICSLLKNRNINLDWGLPAGVRVDSVSVELMQKLKDAGCYRIGFGVESGNELILKIIKKNTTKKQISKAVGLSKRMGFETSCFFMIGNLGETEETINDTIEFSKELNPDVAQFTVAIPYPGTEMFDLLKRQNRITSYNWEDYDYFKSNQQVFEHENLSFVTINKKLDQAYRSFYYRPKYVLKKLTSIKNYQEIGKLFKAFLKLRILLK